MIKTNTSLFDVEEMFTKNLLKGRIQYLVILSDEENIENWEDIKGIITPWDLPQVFSLIHFD